MAWRITDVAAAGEYTVATITGGVWIDPFGSVNTAEIMSRLGQYASGWAPLHIEWIHGLFGFGESLKIYGRADSPVATDLVRNQIIEALNSFWVMAATDCQVMVSDSLSTVLPAGGESWSSSLQLVAVAIIAVAVVWGISQIREVLE
jgi:hypothetical protein